MKPLGIWAAVNLVNVFFCTWLAVYQIGEGSYGFAGLNAAFVAGNALCFLHNKGGTP